MSSRIFFPCFITLAVARTEDFAAVWPLVFWHFVSIPLSILVTYPLSFVIGLKPDQRIGFVSATSWGNVGAFTLVFLQVRRSLPIPSTRRKGFLSRLFSDAQTQFALNKIQAACDQPELSIEPKCFDRASAFISISVLAWHMTFWLVLVVLVPFGWQIPTQDACLLLNNGEMLLSPARPPLAFTTNFPGPWGSIF